MVSNEQALDILKRIKTNKPNQFFNKIDDAEAGMRFILVYLSESQDAVYANTIAGKMQISRARVAVLIQKLANKGLIEKHSSNTDGRIDVLTITEKGLNEFHQLRKEVLTTVKTIIEALGIDEFEHFLETSAKIKKVLEEM